MNDSDNFAEVLTLINRRRRATRSLESVCSLISAAARSDAPTVQAQARELLTLTARRYGCSLTTLDKPTTADGDMLSVTVGVNEYLTLSTLPAAADELRELTWCTSAVSAILDMHRKTMTAATR